jgi:hypothetical protein
MTGQAESWFVAVVVIGVVVGLACAFASASIAQRKGLSAGGYFILGLLLGVIGLIIAVASQPAPPPAAPWAPGWYPDPWQQAPLRWHDGFQWTSHVHAGR